MISLKGRSWAERMERTRAMKYVVVLERTPRNWAAYVPDLPGCITTGKTREDVERNIREAISLHLRGMRRDGDPIDTAWPRESMTVFDLAPLDRRDALALARAHFKSAPDLALRCVDRAQGNPLFLMQLLKSDTDESAVPPTIQSAVLARLDRLSVGDKAALQAASVIGQRFGLDLLRHLIGDFVSFKYVLEGADLYSEPIHQPNQH